ncbi:siderophore-interacting protein [Paludibacterium yongneupense]|uniref:siderophore-interacting protein n=1 Tax=Paludibacterium yongneupense TaxID=400061 RepID=UPI0003FC0C08|nr:siderophore-interacting protein [Paludibacterium yongneupense]
MSGGTDTLAVRRVRHPLKLRLVHVLRIRALSPLQLRITFVGTDMADFASDAFDDHIKIFFPLPGETMPHLPEQNPDGTPAVGGDGPRPIARDYTPRRFDAESGELDIEFLLHGEGPAATWAAQARPGHCIGIGGPRGSFIVPTAFDWHLLAGDLSALPAIARRLEELPAGKRALVLIDTDSEDARIDLPSAAAVDIRWVCRDPQDAASDTLLCALRKLDLPAGEGYAWAAGELGLAQALRSHLIDERGLDKSRVRVASYWKRGAAASHTALDG